MLDERNLIDETERRYRCIWRTGTVHF